MAYTGCGIFTHANHGPRVILCETREPEAGHENKDTKQDPVAGISGDQSAASSYCFISVFTMLPAYLAPRNRGPYVATALLASSQHSAAHARNFAILAPHHIVRTLPRTVNGKHIWLQSKIKLKINHWRSSPEPPELAGFYVDSVKFHFSFTNVH